jgi:glycosyltransferase involved in cell wall biosynthesis
MESFRLRVPVACSRIQVLQEQAGDAAIFFDPEDPGEMADAIVALWTNRELRDRLVTLGQVRAEFVDWKSIAEVFRAHYRRLAGIPLGDRDSALLELSASGEWLPP